MSNEKGISCRFLNKNKIEKFSNSYQEKCLVHFYLLKGACIGITDGSRKIIKKNDGNVYFFQSSLNKVYISNEDYITLFEKTPFISFKIIQKLAEPNRYDECKNIFTFEFIEKCESLILMKILLENIPNISSIHKEHNTLVNQLKNIFKITNGRRSSFIQFIQNKTKNKVNLIVLLNIFFSIYNYICFIIFQNESPSLMKKLEFSTDLESFIDSFMSDLPEFETNQELIKKALMGQDLQYSVFLKKYLMNLFKESTNQSNIPVNLLNKKKKELTDQNRRFITETQNLQIRFFDKYISDYFGEDLERERGIQYFLQMSQEYQEISNYISQKLNKKINNQQLQSLFENMLYKTIEEYVDLFMNKIKINNRNYTTYQKILVNSGYGSIYNLQNGTIRKKEVLINKSIGLMKILNEQIIQFILYHMTNYFINLTPSMLFKLPYQCIPNIHVKQSGKIEQNRNTTFITTSMEKIDGVSLLDFILDPTHDEFFIYHLLQELCNILYIYQTSMNFVHGDLHYENIMIKENKLRREYKIYLIDFGNSSIQLPYKDGNKSNIIYLSTLQKLDIETYYLFDTDFRFVKINQAKSIDLLNLILSIFYHPGVRRKLSKLYEFVQNHTPTFIKNQAIPNSFYLSNVVPSSRSYTSISLYSVRKELIDSKNSENEMRRFVSLFEPHTFESILTNLSQ